MLVSAAWLAEHLHDPNLVVVDLRWREDGSGGARFEAGHVPGAVFCDWATDLTDDGHRFAFMLAGAERFAAAMARLGIGDDTVVVAYADDLGSGPFRLRWACGLYGHPEQVHVLDGGHERWVAEDRGLEAGPPRSSPPATPWTVRSIDAPSQVATADDVASAEHDRSVIVLDSRPTSQFLGEAVWFETGEVPAGSDGIARTPRGDLRAGHVPWARSVPWASLYRPDHTLRDREELAALLAEAGVPVGAGTRVITYCGVGISASALLFALRRAGVTDVRLYDASWDEWGRDPSRPVARGSPETRGPPSG
jgi:thiosulfate/3-mercaptopyruvate sulfurtransferase